MPADYNTKQKPPGPTPNGRYDTTGKTMPSTPGGTNVSMWNTAFHAGPGAPVVDQKWNTRFDWMPSQPGRTYDGKVMANIGPAPMNRATTTGKL